MYLCVCVCEANPERDALRPEGPSQENEERGMDWRQERGKGERERARARERKRERENRDRRVRAYVRSSVRAREH